MSEVAAAKPDLSRSRRFIRRLVVGTLLLNLLACGMAAVMLKLSHERHLANAFIATRNLAQVLERDLSASFGKVDLVLSDIKEEVERQLASDGLQPKTLDSLLARHAFRLPELDALRIASADGALVYGAGPRADKPVNIADRAYFQTMRDDESGRLVFSAPLRSRITGQWTLIVGRRLSTPGGHFAGIVYAAIPLERLRREFAQLELGEQGAVSLRDLDLSLIVRHPALPEQASGIGSNVVSRGFAEAVRRHPDGDVFLAHTAADGIERANAFRRVSRFPLYVVVGLATDDFLADWYAEAAKTLFSSLVFGAISLWLAWQIYRIWMQREGDLLALARQETTLRDSEERFRLLVDGVKDCAIYLVSPDGLVMNWNRGAEHIKQWKSEEILGRHFSVFYPPELVAAGRPEHHLEQAARLGHYTTEEVRVRKDGSRFWAAVTITPVFDEAGEIRGYAKLTRDITERKRTALQQEVRGTVLDRIVRGAPLAEVLGEVIHGIELELPGAACLILLRDPFDARLLPLAMSGSLAERLQLDASGFKHEPCCGGTPLCAGRSAAAGGAQCAVCRALYERWGVSVDLVEPIRGQGDDILGVLLLCHDSPLGAQSFASGLLAHEAALAAIAVERSRSDEALQLAASVYQAIGEAIMVVGPDNVVQGVNPAFTRLTGYLPGEIVGQTPAVLASHRHDRAYYQRMWQSLNTTGRWQGQVCNRHKGGQLLSQWLMISTVYGPAGEVERRIALYSEITDQKLAEEAIWQQANYDPLTLLPNRRLFNDRLEQEMHRAVRDASALTLMLIDLDHFKEVNDTLGHDAGDQLLIEAAARIRACVRETDTVARLGGDEFTVILAGVDAHGRAGSVAQDMVDVLAQPFLIDHATAHVAGSIGVAIFPTDATDKAGLLARADQAMYAAKRAGRGCYRFADEAGER